MMTASRGRKHEAASQGGFFTTRKAEAVTAVDSDSTHCPFRFRTRQEYALECGGLAALAFGHRKRPLAL